MIFNIFKSKPTLNEIIPKGFIDIHSHILPGIDDGAKNVEESIFLIIASEFFFTFLMMFVILVVAIYPKTKGNNYYGIAIGLTVSLGIYLVGNISGAVFNPSVFIGPSFIDYLNGGNTINNIYLYVFSTVSGSLFAVLIYNKFLEKS